MSEHSTTMKGSETSDAALAEKKMSELRRRAADSMGVALIAALGLSVIVSVLIFATR